MEITLRCGDAAVLAQAESRIEAQLEITTYKKTGSLDQGMICYDTNLSDSAGEAVMTELLCFPTLDISAHIHYDIPDRDQSWWGVTKYQSVTDPDGTRRLESSSETHWA